MIPLALLASATATTVPKTVPQGIHAIAEADAVFLGTVDARRQGDNGPTSCAIVEVRVDRVFRPGSGVATGGAVPIVTASVPDMGPDGLIGFTGTPHHRLLPGDQAVFSIREAKDNDIACDSRAQHHPTSDDGIVVNSGGYAVTRWGSFLSHDLTGEFISSYQAENGHITAKGLTGVARPGHPTVASWPVPPDEHAAEVLPFDELLQMLPGLLDSLHAVDEATNTRGE